MQHIGPINQVKKYVIKKNTQTCTWKKSNEKQRVLGVDNFQRCIDNWTSVALHVGQRKMIFRIKYEKGGKINTHTGLALFKKKYQLPFSVSVFIEKIDIVR